MFLMMDTSGQPNLSDDQVSEYRSFCGYHHLCGQPRKISIGIPMDSFSKNSGPKDVNAKDSLVPIDENVAPIKANSAEDGKRSDGDLCTDDKGKQTEALARGISPLLSTRFFDPKLPTSDQVHGAELTRILPTTMSITGIHNRLHVPRVPPANNSVHFFADHMSGSESGKSSQRKFDEDMSGMKDRSGQGVEKLSFTTMQKVVPEKEVVEDKATRDETRGSETLRMKLWEILGTISSPNQQHLSDCELRVGAKNMKLMQKNDTEGIFVVKPGQNSDTIESDSEVHDIPVRRPRTHSLNRSATFDKSKSAKSNDTQSTHYKKENQDRNASFQEGLSARLHYTNSEGLSAFIRNKRDKWSTGIKAHRMCFHVHGTPGQDQQMKNRGERKSSLEKSTSHRNEVGDKNEPYKRRKNDFVEPKNAPLEMDSNHIHLKQAFEHLRNVIDSPKLQNNVGLQEDVGYTFLKSISEQKFDIPIPAFGVNTPKEISPHIPRSEFRTHTETVRSSPGSLPKTKLGEADDDSPSKMMSSVEGHQSFKSFLVSKLTCDKSDSLSNSSDDAAGLEYSCHMKLRPIVEERRSRLSNSSSEGSDSETSKEGSHVKGIEDNKLWQHLELNQGDGLARYRFGPCRQIITESYTPLKPQTTNFSCFGSLIFIVQNFSAISLFALAVERVKSKMKSVVRNISAEILMSVAEAIHIQLRTAESQIQADMAKLTSLNKSKRKRLEIRFQDLQAQLNVIHANFKDKVHRHLQDCRDAVEGLDAHQMELRGIMEKQSASNRKVLLQAEEGIETQLNDAGRRITEVHNLAREKMLQLKYVVANCLNEVS